MAIGVYSGRVSPHQIENLRIDTAQAITGLPITAIDVQDQLGTKDQLVAYLERAQTQGHRSSSSPNPIRKPSSSDGLMPFLNVSSAGGVTMCVQTEIPIPDVKIPIPDVTEMRCAGLGYTTFQAGTSINGSDDIYRDVIIIAHLYQ